ncbi:MAG: S8 family serine peptidase [Cyanobacteria bacterium P01_F01_bin.150]
MNISYSDSVFKTAWLDQLLDNVLESMQTHLADFIARPTFSDDLSTAFGSHVDEVSARQLIGSLADISGLAYTTGAGLPVLGTYRPSIQIQSGSEINNAYGAFSADTNTIYLSHEFLLSHRTDPTAITNVLLEELGHFIDAQLNPVDSKGDEGAIFSSLAQDIDLTPSQLGSLYAETDQVTVELDGQTIQLEQATLGANPAFDLIGLTQLRNDPRFAGIDGSGVSVAVIDTGLDIGNPLIRPNFKTFVDFVDERTTPYDMDDHGTHVAGTVGAADENIGVAPGVDLIGLQVFRSTEKGPRASITDQVEALDWVLQNHKTHDIVAVNMSLGKGFYTSEQQAAREGDPRVQLINQLEEAGVTVVASAGNNYGFKDNDSPNQEPNLAGPAIFSTLAVGAVWQEDILNNSGSYGGRDVFNSDTDADFLAPFSQRLNADNVIFAPGVRINSTIPLKGQQSTKLNDGTSMASPHVAGAVALMQEAAIQATGDRLSPNRIREIIRSTADTIVDLEDSDGDGKIDDNVVNTGEEYKRLNVFRAVESIFNQAQASGDPTGTIQGAISGPVLNGDSVSPISGRIGTDGNTQVGNKDVDIVEFDVLVPGTVTIEVTSQTDQPDDFDSFLRLFDQQGKELDWSDDDGVGEFSKIDIFLDPGTYYAGVSGYDNSLYNPNVAGSGVAGTEGNYELQFNLDSPDPNGLISGAVDVRLGTSREPLTFEDVIGTDYGSLVGANDVDLFKIVIPDNGLLKIDIDTPYETNFVNSFLRLFDENGNELFFPNGIPMESDDSQAVDRDGNFVEFTDSQFPTLTFDDPNNRSSPSGHTTDSFLGALVERGQTYYIGVSDYLNYDYNPTNLNDRPEVGNGGRYELTVAFINNDLDGSIDQAIEMQSLPVTNQLGTIGVDNGSSQVGDKDVDFFKIRSATAGILEMDIDSYTAIAQLPSGTPVDTVLHIFDADGTLLASEDDTNSLDPLLQIPIAANTDYFVAVSGYGNDNFDPFALGSGSAGDTGDYIFNSTLLDASRIGSLTNNAIQSSTNITDITTGMEVFENIGRDNSFVVGATDIDLYRFVPDTSGPVTIQTATDFLASPEDSEADTVLRLFDRNGNELAFNDDASDDTYDSLIQASVTAGQEYFIGVNGYSPEAQNYNPITGEGAAPGSQGSYSLIIQDASTSILPPVPTPSINQIIGTPGNDRLVGTNGQDRIVGKAGNDRLVGKAASDTLIGGSGNDRLISGDGNDRLTGGGGNDRLIGGSGDDSLTGSGGDDRLIGGSGRDGLTGGNGRDILKGGNGKDTLSGSGGNDVLDGGKGNDVIFTGGGRDRIILRQNQGFDQVHGFSPNQDKIDLKGISFNQLTLQQRQDDVLVKLGEKSLLRLNDVALQQIDQSSFV